MADNDAVSASAKGATFLIAVQIASKALTFGLNQLLLRYLSPALLGASVQLELYKIGALYFSRESLRVATERRSGGGVQAAVNLSYLAILSGLPIGLIFAHWYLSVGHPDVPYFVEALRVNEVAALIELCKEPAFVAVQQKMLYKIRAAAEVPGVMMKTFATAALVFWSRHRGVDLGVLPFAAGELANSATMAVIYLYQTSRVAKQEDFSLLPTKMRSSPETPYLFSYLSKPLLQLTASLYFQTGIKWALTEGDKFLIAAFATLEAQGMYALSANYGGFLARMVFKPIEESSRNLFANLCAPTSPPPPEQTQKRNPQAPTQDSDKNKTKTNLHAASTTLHTLLHAYTILSLPLLALGPTLAPLLLHLLAGPHWSASGAASVLGTYCYYIPLLALNGVSEAFVAATADSAALRTQSVTMTIFSFLFAGSAWLFLRRWDWGARGLVGANAVGMGLRVGFNLRYCVGYFRERGEDFHILDLLPSMYAVAGAAIVPSVLAQTADLPMLQPYGLPGELVRIGAIGAVFVGVVAVAERKFVMECYRKVRG